MQRRRQNLRLARGVKFVQRDHSAVGIAPPVPDATLAVVEVRQQHVIADHRHLASYVAKFRAQTPDVHVDDNRSERPAFLGMNDKGFHLAVGRRNVDCLLAHRSVL